MKKLALSLGVVTLATLPLMAHAANTSEGAQSERVIKTIETVTLETKTSTGRIAYEAPPGDYTLTNGKVIRVSEQSKTALFVNPDGSTYYAPSGEYRSTNGDTFFVRDGAIRGFLFSSTSPTVLYEADVDVEGDDGFIHIHEKTEIIR